MNVLHDAQQDRTALRFIIPSGTAQGCMWAGWSTGPSCLGAEHLADQLEQPPPILVPAWVDVDPRA